MMKMRYWAVALLTVALTACSTGVKLDQPPVDDLMGKNTRSALAAEGTGGNASSSREVTPVQVDSGTASNKGPMQVARTVYFDLDSDVIKQEDRAIVQAHARYLQTNQSLKIMLEGHADDRGGREYNLALGQRRAEAVRQAMRLLGVPDAQIEAISYGKEKPVDPGHDEAAYAKNRRVEIKYP